MRVLITGATSGFGKLMTEEFLLAGHVVVATGRRLTQRREILADLRGRYPTQLHEIDLDVTIPKERESALFYCQQNLQGLDVLVNNAGYAVFGALEDCTEEQVRRQMEVNFFGTALMIKETLPLLRASKGSIFNFSSILGLQGMPLTSLYCASKFAVEGLSESLAYELKMHGVRVCSIAPGSFKTGFMDGLDWARGSEQQTSPYLRQTKNYRWLRENMKRNPRYADPKVVARGVVRLAGQHRLPLRVPFGTDARATLWAKKLLPERLYHWFAGLAFRRTFDH